MKFIWSCVALAARLGKAPKPNEQYKSNIPASAEIFPKNRRAIIDNSPTTTFMYNGDNVNFTFTFTANRNGDLWFSMAAPSKFSWMAVGSGDGMADSLMFVAYGDGTPTGMSPHR
jgi:hypothetical protein